MSGVPTPHNDSLTQLPLFSNMLKVRSSDGREFWHLSGVPTPHNDTVTQLPLVQCKSYRTCSVCMATAIKQQIFQGAINTPKPPPLEAADSTDPLACF